MSLLILFPGAAVSVPVAVVTRHYAGKRLRDAATVIGPAGDRQQRRVISAIFAQAPASWAALMDLNDDELAIAFLLLGAPHD